MDENPKYKIKVDTRNYDHYEYTYKKALAKERLLDLKSK